jgi:hypothetical protein
MIQLADSDWAFIPGPREIPDPPASSVALQDVAAYPPDAIAQTFLAYPGFSLAHEADPSWRQWQAEWERGQSFLLVGMTLFETDPVAWGGSHVSGCCELDDLLALWYTIRAQFPAVWMYNSACEIHTPDSLVWLVRNGRLVAT